MNIKTFISFIFYESPFFFFWTSALVSLFLSLRPLADVGFLGGRTKSHALIIQFLGDHSMFVVTKYYSTLFFIFFCCFGRVILPFVFYDRCSCSWRLPKIKIFKSYYKHWEEGKKQDQKRSQTTRTCENATKGT